MDDEWLCSTGGGFLAFLELQQRLAGLEMIPTER
jgi:hypothetical protein